MMMMPIILSYILSRTVFKLLRGIDQIIASDKWLPMVNALVLGNLFEYRHKSCIGKTTFIGLHFVAEVWVYLQPILHSWL